MNSDICIKIVLMKSYEVKMVKVQFTPKSSEKLRAKVEKEINDGARLGWKLFSVDFEMSSQSGYLFASIIFEK